ncbi:MAG: type II toxin-antitoxin system Phd/YefM family antitoxin [Armatimonadetes bacterium]|nr:type II toxin-antitoxin system Phd/YefM family antitoxin [Armatimonadota bacterium]
MLDLRNIHSLTDFLRNHKRHVQRLKDGAVPEVLTVNGKPELVVQSAESYQALLDRLQHAESVAGLRLAYGQVREGKTREYREAMDELRAQHGLSD